MCEEKVTANICVSQQYKGPLNGGNILASDSHKKGIFPPKRDWNAPPHTHTHLVTRAHQKCYFRIILAEVRGLGMQRHRVSQPGQRDSCSNTAISTQQQGQETAFSTSWGGKPSLPKKTLLTTQYLKTGFAKKSSQRTFCSEYLKPWY